jgi:hypothetical protein
MLASSYAFGIVQAEISDHAMVWLYLELEVRTPSLFRHACPWFLCATRYSVGFEKLVV